MTLVSDLSERMVVACGTGFVEEKEHSGQPEVSEYFQRRFSLMIEGNLESEGHNL